MRSQVNFVGLNGFFISFGDGRSRVAFPRRTRREAGRRDASPLTCYNVLKLAYLLFSSMFMLVA